jgi:hypothetical protein
MQYQLTIDIDSGDLQQLYDANQAITIVKSVVSQPLASGNLPIAWVHFQPLQTNVVTWITDYYIYATTTAIQAGASITRTSLTGVPVQPAYTYTLKQGAFATTQGGPAGTFNACNEQGQMLGFGLSQKAMVNNVMTDAPLNVVPVLNNESVTFTPEETVSIFLSNVVNNGVVLSQVASNALSVVLTSQQPSASIGFDGGSNSFHLNSQAALTPHQFAQRLSLAAR